MSETPNLFSQVSQRKRIPNPSIDLSDALTLGQSAKFVGKAKSTICHSIQVGRIPAVRMWDGTYRIKQSDLLKCYPKSSDVKKPATLTGETEAQTLLRLLTEAIAERDKLRAELALALARATP